MSEHDSLLRAIFMEALEIGEPQQRAAFLSRACGADLELRKKVEELLKSEAAACNFLPGQPAASASRAALLQVAEALDPDRSPSVPLAEKPGDRIGRYRLLQKIGEGGCGVVYMAEQEEPVRRKVALKVIKLGMDTRSVMARFDAERQALALMDHPNIAKVLDPGATDTGRPFFVMAWSGASKSPITATRTISPPSSAWSYSSRFARPSSTRIRKGSFTATSNPRMSWLHCMNGLSGKPEAWAPEPARYILMYEPPCRPHGCGVHSYCQWHMSRGKTDFADPRTAGGRFYSPILFVDGHTAFNDFTRALCTDPNHPYEPTKDWIWYKQAGK